MNLWKAPDGIASLNLHGLANNPEARSVLWTATREDGNVVSGNERITGDELRIDVNLKAAAGSSRSSSLTNHLRFWSSKKDHSRQQRRRGHDRLQL